MKRIYYKVGAIYGHCGNGKGVPVTIPILASDVFHAQRRVMKMGGLKKRFNKLWEIEPISPWDYLIIRAEWLRFKSWMRAREQIRKMKRR